MIMDMTSAADRWYDNPRIPGSPNAAGTSHQGGSSSGGNAGNGNNGGIVDPSDMGAFYSLENAGHRRYYSTGYAPGNLLENIRSLSLFQNKKKL